MSRVRMLVTVCVALGVGLAVAAYGDDSADAGPSGSSSDSFELFMISAPAGDDFYWTIEKAARKTARRVGADLEIRRLRKYEASSQLPLLRRAIAKEPDAILVNPVDTDSLQRPLERAAKRGIKIITYDTTTRDPSVVETFVSSDWDKFGRNAARIQLRLIEGKGTVFYQGTLPHPFFDAMQRGWTRVMDKQPAIKQLPAVYGYFQPSEADGQMQAMLMANPDLRGGFAGVAQEQQGIVSALKRAGKLEQVKAVGFDDFAPANIKRLKAGELAALVSVEGAEYGRAVVRAAVKAIKGKDLPPRIGIRQCVLTADNLDDPKNRGCLELRRK